MLLVVESIVSCMHVCPRGSFADPEPNPEGSETFGRIPDPEGSETFGRIRIRSGTEIKVLDPDLNPDTKLDP
jgi:hypothetical protein